MPHYVCTADVCLCSDDEDPYTCACRSIEVLGDPPPWKTCLDCAYPLLRVCINCGCSEERACEGGCAWSSDDPSYCTRCVDHDLKLPFADTERPRASS